MSNSSPMPVPMALIMVRISLLASILSMRAFAPCEAAPLARGRAPPRCLDRLVDDLPRLAGVLLEELGQLGVDRRLDQGADLGVAQLALGLALELRAAPVDRP